MTDSMIPNPSDDDTNEFKPSQEPERPKEQWVYSPDTNDAKALYKSNAYKLACFIMGCLIQEEVVTCSDHNDLGCSDMAVGIKIIATCLEGNLSEGFTILPFEW